MGIMWPSLLKIQYTELKFQHDNFSSVYWIFTKLGHMIPLWKGKNPIYFGVITIILFDHLYRTFLPSHASNRQIHLEYFFFTLIRKVTRLIKIETRKCSKVKDLTFFTLMCIKLPNSFGIFLLYLYT
jgi:hypothetical protein